MPSSQAQLRRLLVVRSPAMKRLAETVEKIVDRDTTILIFGETGCGKDHLAAALHYCGRRSERPFVAIDCSTLTADLFESELFGYERGAFTGALSRKSGRLEQARGGTVYLDQVSALSPPLQAKLLRVLQQKVITRVGGSQTIPLDFRLVASLNASPEALVASGALRRDLLYRLNVVTAQVPPLRERRSDLPFLARRFFRQFVTDLRRDKLLGIEPDGMRSLQEFQWPGNVRQLRNVIERAVIVASHDQIRAQDLALNESVAPSELLGQAGEGLWPLEELERRYILEVLRRTRNSYTKAAAILGVNRKTLLEKRKRYALQSVLRDSKNDGSTSGNR